MTRAELLAALEAAPARIAAAEWNVLDAGRALLAAREALADREAALTLGQVFNACFCLTYDDEGVFEPDCGCERCCGSGRVAVLIDGKNEQARAAQLRQATTAERAAVEGGDRAVALARRALDHERNAFSAARSIARVLGPPSEAEGAPGPRNGPCAGNGEDWAERQEAADAAVWEQAAAAAAAEEEEARRNAVDADAE